MSTDESIRRIKPTDVPFAESMTEAEVNELAGISAFRELSPEFLGLPAFKNILRTHARKVCCQDGDIIVREGDWGNSAFFVISGTVVVELEPPDTSFAEEVLGRDRPDRKGFFQSLAQLWTNHTFPEFRDKVRYARRSQRIGRRGTGMDTRIYLQDVPGVMERYKHLELKAGQIFGELAALGRTARAATVFAKGAVELLEIRWQGLRDLMRRAPGIKKLINDRYRTNALAAFLRNSPIFEDLTDDDEAMGQLIREAQLETYGDYDRVGSFREMAKAGAAAGLETEPLIAEEGHHPNGVVLIRSGLARLSQRYHHGHRTVSYLTPGQIYGFEEIAEGWRTSTPVPLRYSLRAIGYLTAVIVSTPLIEKHLLDRIGRRAALRKLRPPRNRLARKAPTDVGSINQSFLEFLVENRIVNGRATMLIDLDRCTRCDDCVRACASTHDNNPRFLRHGPVHDNVMVANACMHCEDPVCMIECPTGAISRRLDGGEVTINDDTCIGCGTCARNCPYDAIRMVEVRDLDAKYLRDHRTHAPIPKATKCDLCVDQWSGPACQRACPHDALIRINMGDVDSLVKWHNR